MKDTDRHPNLIDRLRHRGGEASPAHHVSSADQERPAVDIVKEIRFAVVMYGANDRLDMREAGAYVRFRSDDWRAVYAGRIEYEWEGKPHLYHMTFIVKRPPRRAKAPLLVLCSTNTWRAYNATPFAKPDPALKRNFSTE